MTSPMDEWNVGEYFSVSLENGAARRNRNISGNCSHPDGAVRHFDTGIVLRCNMDLNEMVQTSRAAAATVSRRHDTELLDQAKPAEQHSLTQLRLGELRQGGCNGP